MLDLGLDYTSEYIKDLFSLTEPTIYLTRSIYDWSFYCQLKKINISDCLILKMMWVQINLGYIQYFRKNTRQNIKKNPKISVIKTMLSFNRYIKAFELGNPFSIGCPEKPNTQPWEFSVTNIEYFLFHNVVDSSSTV